MRKRVPAEHCRRLLSRDIRRMVQVGADSVVLEGNKEIKLRWIEVKGYCAPAKSVRMLCPECDKSLMVIWNIPDGSWLCKQCARIDYPSTGVPEQEWHSVKFRSKKQQCLKLLGLAQWPPANPDWNWHHVLELPRRPDAPQTKRKRAQALAQRLAALDSLELCYSGTVANGHHSVNALKAAGHEVLRATNWATRRQLPDPRWEEKQLAAGRTR